MTKATLKENQLGVWMRMGVYIRVDEEEFKVDPAKALIEAIKSGGLEINGDSYIPAEEYSTLTGNDICDNVEIDFPELHLIVKNK